jgi:RND family efflux transporter MFP subunit
MRKRWLIGGLGVVVAVAAGVGAAMFMGRGAEGGPAYNQASGGKGGKEAKPDVPLEFAAREVVQPMLASLPVTIQFSGPLVAPDTAVVRAKAAGTLTALNVAEGSRVKAGQALGSLDLAELNSRVTERNAMYESARAQVAQAERTYNSNVRLADQQFISTNALDASRAALDTARAQMRAAQAQTDTLRVTQRDAALIAPISGVVAKRHVVPGEKLAMEQQVLTIVDLAKLELAGSVGTHEVSLLSPGMPVEVRVEGLESRVAGKVERIAPAAEAGTRSIGVTITIDNPKETYRAGQYAMAQVVLQDSTQRLTVPVSAIGTTSGQEHVWVIENGTLARRAITTGRRDDGNGRVEVLQGLPAGAQVIAARFDNLREGAKANVAAVKAPPVASAAASSATVLK